MNSAKNCSLQKSFDRLRIPVATEADGIPFFHRQKTMNIPGTNVALDCFTEATRQTPRDTNPAQWNIASGLAHIAQAMNELEVEIRTLRSEVRALSQK